MRLAGRERLGFYPLPIAEAKRIRTFLQFPEQVCSALDPCIGEGVAFAEVTRDAKTRRYGIELEAQRAALARSSADEVIHGNCFDVQCPVESFSLIYLNPPYDFEIGEDKSQRMERLFLDHVYRWLKRGGVLILVIPWDLHPRLRPDIGISIPRRPRLPPHRTRQREVQTDRCNGSATHAV